jgi:hypothetical protein
MKAPPIWLQPYLRSSLQRYNWHKLLPTTRWGDCLYAHLLALLHTNRWPQAVQGNLNDFLAYLKCSKEIETPLRQQLSDKELVKTYIREKLGPDACVPTLGVLHNDREIDQFTFPHRCVIKPTHSSGQILFRQGGEPVDLAVLKKWLRFSHYRRGRERNYRNLTPKIIVEPWLEFHQGSEVKMNVVRGKPTVVSATSNLKHGTPTQLGLFNAAGKYLVPQHSARAAEQEQALAQIISPKQWDNLLETARQLTTDLVFARVDFYLTDSTIYVGEITSVPGNGILVWDDPAMAAASQRTNFGSHGFNLADFPELTGGFSTWQYP